MAQQLTGEHFKRNPFSVDPNAARRLGEFMNATEEIAPDVTNRFFKSIEKADETTGLELLDACPSLVEACGSAATARFNRACPPLLLAAELGLPVLTKALLDRNASVRSRGALGGSPLHWACWCGHQDVVQQLLPQDAELEQRDTEYQCTPLFWTVHGYSYYSEARRIDQVSIARALLDQGANPDTRNRSGTAAIDLLSDPADTPMKSLLLAALKRTR